MKKWCECSSRCMVRNPRKEVVHGSHRTYDSRHNCRCTLCIEAYKQNNIDREFVLISKYLQRSAYEQSNA
jgi:hypothetical protein